VFGDGVNIAARIEPLAEPGGICLSGEVYSVVRKKIEYKFEQLEGVKLKNIAIAPDIYRVVLT
ncbi:MAG: adenylate/guanylate cyclase domain-containing protein, partial [Betaproteobacteria bacterium]|nr:adenylate/guanylate cyclase domain-containing protein [Betaproteobacteria bacterium]